MDKRLPWPDYFMRIAYLVAERSTCLRRKVGAVAVRDRRILATGYNGSPTGTAHCLDIGCLCPACLPEYARVVFRSCLVAVG